MTLEERIKTNSEYEVKRLENIRDKQLKALKEHCSQACPDDYQIKMDAQMLSIIDDKIIQEKDRLENEMKDLPLCKKEMDMLERYVTNLFGDDLAIKRDDEAMMISFLVPSKTVSVVVITLANYLNWSSTYFGFSSSFTTHEAKTSFGRVIKAGIDPYDNNRFLVDYDFIKG